MAAGSGRISLPRGFKKLQEKKTYVFAYISVKQLRDPWNVFTKNLLRGITEAQGSNVEIDMLVNRAYANSLEKSVWNYYESMGLQGSYLYPTVPGSSHDERIKIIEESIFAQNCVDIVYSSNKLDESGDALKIKRLYIGRIYDYDLSKDIVTLRIGETFRSFKISKLDTVDEFNKRTKAEVRHLKVEFEPLSNGGATIVWNEILGETDELIAKPWEGSSEDRGGDEPKRTGVERPRPEKAKLTFDYLAAEGKLEALYNEFITVVEGSSSAEVVRTSLKMKGFRVFGGSPKAVILGESGITLEVNLDATKIIRKKNSEQISFS